MRSFKTVMGYLKFFDGIPANKWQLGPGSSPSRTCALGHFHERGFPDYRHPLNTFLGGKKGGLGIIVAVNDGWNDSSPMWPNRPNYLELGDSPKERVMNALILKAAGVWDELMEDIK